MRRAAAAWTVGLGLILVAAMSGPAHAAPPTVWTANAFERIFQPTPRPAGAPTSISWDAARNERQSAQVLLRHTAAFTITGVTFTDLAGPATLGRGNLRYNLQQYYDADGDGGGHPDPLSNDPTIAVGANATQGIWFTVSVPRGQAAGTYTGSATVRTTAGDQVVPISLRVYAVEIPDPADSEYVSGTWSVFMNGYADSDGGVIADEIWEKYEYTRYSPQWWTLMDNIAEEMKAQRHNQLHVSIDLVLDGGSRLVNGQYVFNWSRFDQFIERFLAHGAVTTFRGNPLLNAGPGGSNKVWFINSSGKIGQAAVGTAAANKWLNAYIPALKAHLDAKGWTAMWYQTISDEPSNPDNYADMVVLYRSYFGSISTIQDAINGRSTDYVGSVDIWIPSVQEFEDADGWYGGRQELGEQVWSYTCGFCWWEYPSNWLDRMTLQEPYNAKLIAWGNYRYGITGFFHWGYNAWEESGYTGTGGGEPRPGDGYIVYPDKPNNTVRSSVRGIATRDGHEDYELLKILGDHDPSAAHDLARSLVESFDVYSTDPSFIAQQSKALLAAAESAAR